MVLHGTNRHSHSCVPTICCKEAFAEACLLRHTQPLTVTKQKPPRRKRPPKKRPENPRPALPTLAAVVKDGEGLSWNQARELIRTGRAWVGDERVTDPTMRVDPEKVRWDINARKQTTGMLADERILFVDRHLVVVLKEAGELTVPYSNERDTLVDRLRVTLRRRSQGFDPPLGVVHRLDKTTSGVLVFTRDLASKRAMSQLFREHDIERRYVAIAHDHVRRRAIESHLIKDRGDGLRGSFGVFRKSDREPPRDARWSKTIIKSVSPLIGASHVTLELETGRQHQIRIHLAEGGNPLVGEHVYIRDRRRDELPIIAAPRPMLHAARLGFVHPHSGRRLRFDAPVPADFEAKLKELSAPALGTE